MEELKSPKKQGGETYTLGGGDVHVAADEGQAVVHAHLEINHSGNKQDGFFFKTISWSSDIMTADPASCRSLCVFFFK